MNRNLVAVLAALILAVPARAGVVAPAGASAHPWASSVAGVFSSVGAARIATFGSPSLTALSTLNSDSLYPFVATPRVLDLLVKNLELYNVTPADFAPLSDVTEYRFLKYLRTAAKNAEIEAAAIADQSLAAARSHPLHPSSVDRISEQVATAEDVAFYLNAPRREEVARMRSSVASFQSRWRKHVEKFRRELPQKIAAEAFDAANILVKTEHGWVAADESPYPIGRDLSQFYERRLEALRKAPQGLWTIREATLLGEALDRPDIGGEKAWSEPARQWIGRINSHAYESFLENQPLMSAREAFQWNARAGLPVAARHILTVETYYKEALNSPMPASNRLRVLAAIRNGAGGLPSWERFRAIDNLTFMRILHNILIALGVVGAIGVGMLAIPGLSVQAGILYAFFFMATCVVIGRALLLAQSLGVADEDSELAKTLRQTFPND